MQKQRIRENQRYMENYKAGQGRKKERVFVKKE